MGITNKFPPKDPRDKLDYTILYSSWLPAGDQITGSNWTARTDNPDSAMSIISTSFTTGSATIWLASGTVCKVYGFENQIGTIGGRDKNQTVIVPVKDE